VVRHASSGIRCRSVTACRTTSFLDSVSWLFMVFPPALSSILLDADCVPGMNADSEASFTLPKLYFQACLCSFEIRPRHPVVRVAFSIGSLSRPSAFVKILMWLRLAGTPAEASGLDVPRVTAGPLPLSPVSRDSRSCFVPGGFCHFFSFITSLLLLTSCRDSFFFVRQTFSYPKTNCFLNSRNKR